MAVGAVIVVGAEITGVLLERMDFLASPLGLAALVAFLGGLLLLMASLKNRRQRLARWRAELMARTERLAEQYPEEVQAWGGRQELHNPDLLREILAAVQDETPAVHAPEARG